MKRRKFFTFISLFGICFTLLILIVLTALIDDATLSGYPENHRDRTLFVSQLVIRTKDGANMQNFLSPYFVKTYLKTLKVPEKVAFSSLMTTADTYTHDEKIRLYYKYTDANFWDVTQYRFLEGKPYTQTNLDANDHVVVITDAFRNKLFGKNQSATGKSFELENVLYRIIGVVKECSIVRFTLHSDVFIPYTLDRLGIKSTELYGNYLPMLLAKTPGEVAAMDAEFDEMVRRIKIPNQYYGKLYLNADTFLPSMTRFFSGAKSSGVNQFYTIIGVFLVAFMALPAVNLINLNTSRIMERSSEIGIRKAFGASNQTLVLQFLTENIFLTLVGGILALILAAGVLMLINASELIPGSDLHINWRVTLYALGLILLFGVFSGVYPAWRMSRLQIAAALKDGE
ncbi:MAG: ABC transporter permease [Siphonobacter sp.]